MGKGWMPLPDPWEVSEIARTKVRGSGMERATSPLRCPTFYRECSGNIAGPVVSFGSYHIISYHHVYEIMSFLLLDDDSFQST